MILCVAYAYNGGLSGIGQDPLVVDVPDIAAARRNVLDTIARYEEELSELEQGMLEASPVSVRPEIEKGVIVIDFGTYIEGEENPIIVETKRRVEAALKSITVSQKGSGLS